MTHPADAPAVDWRVVRAGPGINAVCRAVLEQRGWAAPGAEARAGPASSATADSIEARLLRAVRERLGRVADDDGSAVCARRLSFFDTPAPQETWLFEVLEGSALARWRFLVTLEGDRISGGPYQLDWSSAPIHRLNTLLGLKSFDDPQRAWDYLDYFCGSLSGQQTAFVLLGKDPPDGFRWNSDAGRAEVEAARMAYDGALFRIRLLLEADGGVEMLDDEPIEGEAPPWVGSLDKLGLVDAALTEPQAGPAGQRIPWSAFHVGSRFPGTLRDILAPADTTDDFRFAHRILWTDELDRLFQADDALIRARPLSCYDGGHATSVLFEVFRPGDGGRVERARFIAIADRDEQRTRLVCLDWRSNVIHALNRELGLQFAAGDEERVGDYLEFFCSSLAPESADAGIATFALGAPVGRDCIERAEDGSFVVSRVLVAHGSRQRLARFRVQPDGRVEMLEDEACETPPGEEIQQLQRIGLFVLEEAVVDILTTERLLSGLEQAAGRGDPAGDFALEDVLGGDGKAWQQVLMEAPGTRRWLCLQAGGGTVRPDSGRTLTLLVRFIERYRQAAVDTRVWITGDLDLGNMTLPAALTLDRFRIDGVLRLRNSRIEEDLALADIDFRKSFGKRGRNRFDLDLRGLSVKGSTTLHDVGREAGDYLPSLTLRDATLRSGLRGDRLLAHRIEADYLHAPRGHVHLSRCAVRRAFSAAHAQVGGDLIVWDQCLFCGGASFQAATLSGNLQLEASHFKADHNGIAVCLNQLSAGSVLLDAILVDGDMTLSHCRVRDAVYARTTADSGPVEIDGNLILGGARVDGHMEFEALTVRGSVDMVSPGKAMAVYFRPGRVPASDRPQPCRIGHGLYIRGLVTETLDLTGLRMLAPQETARGERHAVFDQNGTLVLADCRISGNLSFFNPALAKQLRQEYAGAPGFAMPRARLGKVQLENCTIGGRLDLTGLEVLTDCQRSWDAGGLLDLQGLQAGEVVCEPVADLPEVGEDGWLLDCRVIHMNGLRCRHRLLLKKVRAGLLEADGSLRPEARRHLDVTDEAGGRGRHSAYLAGRDQRTGILADFIDVGSDFELDNSCVEQLQMRHARVGGRMRLYGWRYDAMTISRVTDLSDSDLAGDLYLQRARLEGPLHLDGLELEGTLQLAGTSIGGEARMRSMKVGRDLRISPYRIRLEGRPEAAGDSSGDAPIELSDVDLTESRIGGKLAIDGVTVRGELRLNRLREIGALELGGRKRKKDEAVAETRIDRITGAAFPVIGDISLCRLVSRGPVSLTDCAGGGDLVIEDVDIADGEIDGTKQLGTLTLAGTRVKGDIGILGGHVTALDLDDVTAGNLFLGVAGEGVRQVHCTSVTLNMATIEGDARLEGLCIDKTGNDADHPGRAIQARGAAIKGKLRLCPEKGAADSGTGACARLNGRGIDLSSARVDHLVVSGSCIDGERPHRQAAPARGHASWSGAAGAMAALFALYPLALLAACLVPTAPRLAQAGAWPLPLALLAGTLLAVLAHVAGRAVAALGLLTVIVVLFLVNPFGLLEPTGLGVGERLTWAVLLAASLSIARRFWLLAGEMGARVHCGYDQWDRGLPMARSVLPLPGEKEAGSPANARRIAFRTFHAISALASMLAAGGVLALAAWHWPDGPAIGIPFWATGLFFLLGYLFYLLFDVWQINWLSHRALGRQGRSDPPGGEDETGFQQLRGRLRARQLAFADVLQVLGLPIATRIAPPEPKVIVERARIGHWQMSEPFPDQVDLSNVSVDRWTLGSGDGDREKRILRILEHSSEFKRSTYSSMERTQRNQGNRQLADQVHRAMRRQEQWREQRRFATALMLLHSIVGYGTKRAPILAFMAVWYVFTALWFAVDHADAVTLTPETRMSLLEITQDPEAAGVLAEALDPGCRNGGGSCGWTVPAPDPDGTHRVPATLTSKGWLARLGHGFALATRYHLPIIGWDPWPYLAPRGEMWLYAGAVNVIHWILWPLLLASLIQTLIPQREN